MLFYFNKVIRLAERLNAAILPVIEHFVDPQNFRNERRNRRRRDNEDPQDDESRGFKIQEFKEAIEEAWSQETENERPMDIKIIYESVSPDREFDWMEPGVTRSYITTLVFCFDFAFLEIDCPGNRLIEAIGPPSDRAKLQRLEDL